MSNSCVFSKKSKIYRKSTPLVQLKLLIFFNYLVFQSFEFEGTRLRSFQTRVVGTKFDMYVFIVSEDGNKVYISSVFY
jgi:hypothetical protein